MKSLQLNVTVAGLLLPSPSSGCWDGVLPQTALRIIAMGQRLQHHTQHLRLGRNVLTPQAGFPVLVRLTSATTAFSFGQAMAAGQDIRFSTSAGTHIPYQIERFDQGNQLAEIWVKADVNPNDNAQYITMYWGKPGSADSSNGPAVFGAANGFMGAWHLNETGNVNPNGYADAVGASRLTALQWWPVTKQMPQLEKDKISGAPI